MASAQILQVDSIRPPRAWRLGALVMTTYFRDTILEAGVAAVLFMVSLFIGWPAQPVKQVRLPSLKLFPDRLIRPAGARRERLTLIHRPVPVNISLVGFAIPAAAGTHGHLHIIG